MKKVFTTPEYKLIHNRRSLKKINPKRKRKSRPKRSGRKANIQRSGSSIYPTPVFAPEDFRLIENTEHCLWFFRELRSELNLNRAGNLNFVQMSLKYVNKVDYGAISILTAISDDLKYKRISLRGDMPDDSPCRQFMVDSGYLNNLYDGNRKKFPKSPKADLLFFEKGCGVLSEKDNRKISELVKNVVNHLTGELKHCLPVKTIILEICGNSIEWSGTENKQWLLGAKYEESKVVFTVTDVGKGILETLVRKFKLRFIDAYKMKKDNEILAAAFDQKYGSSTQEINRNKGLLSVKAYAMDGTIEKLKVITNNVILHFGENQLSKTMPSGSPRFKGTFYQWELTKDSLGIMSNI